MKEKIYTIPVNEAFETSCECPLCWLEARLEQESIDYELGAAMMEADHREQSDKTGFCNKHLAMMFDKPNRLSLALVLDTRMEAIRKELSKAKKDTINLCKSKGGLFKKNNGTDATKAFSDFLTASGCGCMVCEKVNLTMDRYIDVLLYMWANDEEFKKKFDNSKGFCLKHAKSVVQMVPKSLKGNILNDFMNTLVEKEEKELERIQNDIHKFTLKFDYRNKDMDWGTAYDAPIRTIEKLVGYIQKEEK